MFENYDHLGFHNPYYFDDGGQFVIKKSFAEITGAFAGKKEIDVIAVIELLSTKFCLGDRTLVQNIQRSPWMAKPNAENTAWEHSSVPDHFEKAISEEEIAKNLFEKICREVLEYVGDKKKVGILLSGGMDSRIVAGTLDYLIKTGVLTNISVQALTWGNENSRDVVYSREIAKRLNWDWKHYTVGAEDILRNIDEAAVRGAEYSGIHLHALPQMRDDIELDCVLAGSYGDSVGRAEYSGTKVTGLQPIDKDIFNIGYLRDNAFNGFKDAWKGDVKIYHDKYPQKKTYQQYEQDYQLHYMRRMLNPCMEVLGDRTKFYQVFTKPDVFGYMWSINPEMRNNNIYKLIMEYFTTKLNDIPWARTGLIYDSTAGVADQYLKNHHSYRKITTTEIYGEIRDRVLCGELEKLNIFNIKAIKKMLQYLHSNPSLHFNDIERLVWLASLAKTVKIYGLGPAGNFEENTADYYNSAVKIPFKNLTQKMYRVVKPVKK